MKIKKYLNGKIMDYKEKYDKLVEAVKVLQEENPSDEGIQNWVNDNVPELAESRDEKVRKWIYNYFRSCFPTWIHPDITCGEILAWLEKQGNPNKEYWRGYKDGKKAILDKYSETCKVVEPKFKVGDCIVHDISDGRKVIRQIINMTNKSYILDGEDFNTFYFNDLENDYHLWTIQDAKDGDVLNANGAIFIYRRHNIAYVYYYCGVNLGGEFVISENGNEIWNSNSKIYPATKEQRDMLFQKMHEAGYTFNFEKKELKKIDNEEVNGEDYGIDGLYHAQRILEKTLGEVDGYQTDDGILDHKAAITAVKKLYGQKPAEWSHKDDVMVHDIIGLLPVKTRPEYNQRREDWLKSLKCRVQPEQEWSEEDEEMVEGLNSCLDELEEKNGWRYIYVNSKNVELNKVRNWVKSLKQRIGE